MIVHDIAKHAAFLTIGVASLATGAWFLTLRGLHQDLAASSARVMMQSVELKGAAEPTPDAERIIRELENRIGRSSALIDQTPKADRLYDAIQDAGTQAEVSIERLEPSNSARHYVELKGCGVKAEAITFDMEISATYPQLVRFLALMEQNFGLAKVVSFRVRPLPGAGIPRVAVNLATMHFIVPDSAVIAAGVKAASPQTKSGPAEKEKP